MNSHVMIEVCHQDDFVVEIWPELLLVCHKSSSYPILRNVKEQCLSSNHKVDSVAPLITTFRSFILWAFLFFTFQSEENLQIRGPYFLFVPKLEEYAMRKSSL